MDMQEIVARVRNENFPEHAYIVFGSGPMAAAGLRKVHDIDLLVSRDLYADLKQRGWREGVGSNGGRLLSHEAFEASDDWQFGDYRPHLDQLLARADMIEGIAIASLKDVREWKRALHRDKDIADIVLIDEYCNTQA